MAARKATQQKRTAASLDPSTPSLAYRTMAPRWELLNAVLGGTETMREAGETLLPKHDGEGQKHYDERANTAVFTNFTRLTLDFLTGKPYSEKALFTENAPQELLDLESDIDLQGNDLTTVTKDYFWKGLGKGFSYMMVEYPKQDQTEITLQQKQTQGLRPYWVVISPENVLADPEIRINGKSTNSSVRILVTTPQEVGFDEVLIQRIFHYELLQPAPDPTNPNRVIEDSEYRVQVTIYKKDPANKRNPWPVEQSARILNGLTRIPLVKFQTNADGRPELLDLAYLNVAHWQSYADQRACITMSRFPILAGSGVDEPDGRVIGPYELLVTSDPTAKFYYVENSGAAIGVGNSDVTSLEDKMAMYGAELLKKRPGRETATSRIIDATQNMAPLQIIVLQFMSCLQEVCELTMQLLGIEDPPTDVFVRVNLDFAMSEEQQKQMQFVENARLQGDMSREEYFAAAKELGYMPDTFNPTNNQTGLAAELQDYFKQLAAVAAATPDPTVTGEGSVLNDQTPTKINRSATISDRNKTNG